MPDTKMVKVVDYCSVVKGKIGIKKAIKGEYPLVTTAGERLSHNEYHFDRPSVIIPLVSSTGHGHASLKRIHYQEGKFAVGSILCAVTPKDESVLNAQFLYHYLDVYKEKLLVSCMKGMANVTLPVSEIENVQFPLLSTDKQKEWVSLFENTSSYTNSLTSEIDYQQLLLKKLRQSILQDGISGKLSEKWRRDNPDVEPASELLARIKAEKERLVTEKKIKKQKPLPPITEDEIPFELPEGWEWCQLENLSNSIHYGATKSAKKVNQGIRLLRITDIQENKVSWDSVPGCDCSQKDIEKYKLSENDILIARTGGTIGKSYLVNNMSVDSIFASYLIRVIPDKHIQSEYLKRYLESPSYWVQLYEAAWGAGQPNVNGTKLKSLFVSLPPLSEQKTIVAEVEKLFNYCDELEQQIDKSQQDSELLMQAVLKEAFEIK